MSKTYRAQCQHERDDFMNAFVVGTAVHIQAYGEGESASSVSLDASAARTFARGILALAGEIDGGEASKPAVRSVKIGDRLRVTRDRLEVADVRVGDVAVVVEFVSDDESGDFRAVVDGGRWRFGPENIGNGLEFVDEAPKDEQQTTSVKVGDTVRVVRNAMDYEGLENVGRVGTLTRIDPDDQPYQVRFDDEYWWCAEVELVDEPTTTEALADDRETFVRRAAQLAHELNIWDGDAVVSMARFLAGE